MKYIPADKLIAEIERQSKSIENATGDFAEGRRGELDNLHRLITSLQQEKPEVDVEKEIAETLGNVWAETPEEVQNDMSRFARYFWNKGYNARRNE